MKIVKVELKIEMDDDAKGFVLVPTSDPELLSGPYAVNTSPVVMCKWNCRNGVSLREEFTDDRNTKSD